MLSDPTFLCGNNTVKIYTFLAFGFEFHFSVMSILVEPEKPTGSYMVQGNELANSQGN